VAALKNPRNDQELVTLLRDGDVTAYTELFDRYQPLLFVYARKITCDRDVAADIVQEVFIYLWDKRETIQFDGSVLSYLYSAVRYKFFNLLDKQKVRADYAKSLQTFIAQGSPLTDHYIREKEMLKLIEEQISLLPKKLRVAYELSHKANMSTTEIAEMTGVSEKTVKNQVSMAVQQLKVKLGILSIAHAGISFELLLELLKKK